VTPRKRKKRILVKGYMRPDGTSYYVAIPKAIRELLSLEGGEYFMMKADAKDGEIELKLVDFEEDTTTDENSPELKEKNEEQLEKNSDNLEEDDY
jgi:AbrB family looped-hinge helix DNA binding protein